MQKRKEKVNDQKNIKKTNSFNNSKLIDSLNRTKNIERTKLFLGNKRKLIREKEFLTGKSNIQLGKSFNSPNKKCSIGNTKMTPKFNDKLLSTDNNINDISKKLTKALSCEYCGGIYINPYIINLYSCSHIFCMRCILKMLEYKQFGNCPKCKTKFENKDIKHSEVTELYLKTFFPQYAQNDIKIDNLGKKELKKDEQNKENEEEENEKIVLNCELRPLKEKIKLENRLPQMMTRYRKIGLVVKSGKDDVVNILKKYILGKLNMKGLKEKKDMGLVLNDCELSEFSNFSMMKQFFEINPKETISFFYYKKDKK